MGKERGRERRRRRREGGGGRGERRGEERKGVEEKLEGETHPKFQVMEFHEVGGIKVV